MIKIIGLLVLILLVSGISMAQIPTQGYDTISECTTDTKTIFKEKIIDVSTAYIHYNNVSKKEETRFYFKPTLLYSYIDYINTTKCQTIGVIKGRLNAFCPDNFRCDIINDELCYMDCSAGDCNYAANENKNHGWNYVCKSIDNLQEGAVFIDSKEIARIVSV